MTLSEDARARARVPRRRRRHADRADGLLQSDLRLRRRTLPRRCEAAGVDGLIVVDLPPEEDEELCLPALAGRHQLHPPGDADHRRHAPAGRARQHVGLCLLRLDHRHHRRGRAGRRQGRRRGGAHQAPHQAAGRRGLRRAQRRAGARASRASADGVVVGSALVDAVLRDSLDDDGKATARTVTAVDGSWWRELRVGVLRRA